MPSKVGADGRDGPFQGEDEEISDDNDDMLSIATTTLVPGRLPGGKSHVSDNSDDGEASEKETDENSDENDDTLSVATTALVPRDKGQGKDNNEKESEGESDSDENATTGNSPGKRKRGDDSDDDDDVDRLEDDDYDLLEENTGIRFKKKFRRVKVLDDDDSDDDATALGTREQIAEELFDLDDDTDSTVVASRTATADKAYSSEESSEDEIDDFIVDDSGAPVTRRKRRKRTFVGDVDVTDERLQSAQDIFGVDFEVEDLDGNVDDDDSEDEEARRPRSKATRKPVTLGQIYEPAVLEHMHYTDKDVSIRQTDIPERFQRQDFEVQPPVEYMVKYLRDEASWIYDEMVKMKELGVNAVVAPSADSFNPTSGYGQDDWDDASSSVTGVPAGRLCGTSESAFSTQSTRTAKPKEDDDDWETPSVPSKAGGPTETEFFDPWDDDTASSIAGVPAGRLCESVSETAFSTQDEFGSVPTSKATSVVTPGTANDDDWDDTASSVSGVPAGTFSLSAGKSTCSAVPDDDDGWDKGSVLIPTQIAPGLPINEVPPIATSSIVGRTPPAAVTTQQAGEALKEAVTTIIEGVLKHMKYELLEVPFIIRYRKDTYAAKLLEKHLWLIYHLDMKYTKLYKSKKSLQALATSTCTFMSDERNVELVKNTLGRKHRKFTEDDVCFINKCNSFEELSDYRSFYSLYYGKLSPIMKSLRKKCKIVSEKEKERADWDNDDLNTSVSEIDDANSDAVSQLAPLPPTETLRVIRQSKYERLYSALNNILDITGITMSQLAVNISEEYAKHKKEAPSVGPNEVAEPLVSVLFPTTTHVLEGVQSALATQLAREPLVKKFFRNFLNHPETMCTLTVFPTEKGRKVIDEFHILYPFKYITNKRIDDFQGDCFLKLLNGEQDKLLEVQYSYQFVDRINETLVKAWISLYSEDGCSLTIKEWNRFRASVVKEAIEILMPQFLTEVKSRLEAEGKEFVMKECRKKIKAVINVGKINLGAQLEQNPPDEWNTDVSGLRVMAIAYEADPSLAPFACVMKSGGTELVDYCTIGKLMFCYKSNEILCEEVKEELRRFLRKNKPHFIVVSGESFDADNIVDLIKGAIESLRNSSSDDEFFPEVPVEIISNAAAKVYSLSKLAVSEYGEYPIILRQAISLARSMLDPLVELGQLYNSDEDILCINFHPFQGKIDKEKLLEEIGEEFVDVVNNVGVDFNECLKDPRKGHLLQFICGLGPAKAAFLLRTFTRKTTSLLLNREQLHSIGKLESVTFINCAGFIRINVKELENGSDDVFLEYLDSTRIHPANYTQARFIAHDALAEDEQYDESVVEVEYVQKILDDPQKYAENVQTLDIVEYNNYLVDHQKLPPMTMILEDIVKEFAFPFKDPRPAFKPPSPEESFYFLSKETPDTFYVGKLLNAKVVGFSKSKCEVLESPETIIGTTCQKCDEGFPTVEDLVKHTLNPKGVHIMLDNGLRGYMKSSMLSDKSNVLVMERVKIGQVILCRINEFDPAKRMVLLTSRSSDLRDEGNNLKPKKDSSYEEARAFEDQKLEMKAPPAKTSGVIYQKRAIAHASFHNITYQECKSRLEVMDNGDALFRPSSKGSDHLTLSWKLMDGVIQHVDITETKQDKTTYFIDGEEYEDLDEILTRYVYPMSSFVKDIIGHKYYIQTNEGYSRQQVELVLREKYSENPRQLPYVLSAFRERPGRFLLSYLVGGSLQTKVFYRHEIIKIVPEGYYYRHLTLETVTKLLHYFKRHFRDPPPTETPMIGSATMTGSVQLF